MIPEERLRQAAQRAQEALLDSLPETPAAHTFSPRPTGGSWTAWPAGWRASPGRPAGSSTGWRGSSWRWCVWGRGPGDQRPGPGGLLRLDPGAKGGQPVVHLPGGRRPGGHAGGLPDHRAGGVPAGRGRVGESFRAEDGGYVRERYVNAAGEEICFTYVYGTDRWKDMAFAMEDRVARKNLRIHGNPAELYLSPEPEGRGVILWIDYATGALLEVAAPWRRRTSSPWQRAPRRWNPTFPEKISHSVSKTTAPFRYRG